MHLVGNRMRDAIVDRSSLLIKHVVSRLSKREFWITIGAGQLLSLLICGTAIFSELIATKTTVIIPIGQTMFVYWALLLIFGPIHLIKKRISNQLDFDVFIKEYMWKYMLIAFLEVQGNYLAIMAYRYTSAVSVQILDCMAIPIAFILSMFILKYKYHPTHYVGMVVAVVGAVVIFIAGAADEKSSNSTHGNGLAAGAGIIYGIANVMQELLIRQRPWLEYLFALGLFGSFMSTIQSLSLEFGALEGMAELMPGVVVSKFVGYLVGFIIVMLLFYVLLPMFIRKRLVSAVSLNISLQTSDIYTFLISLALFNYKFSPLYIVAWLLVLFGSILFNTKDPSL